MSGIDADRTVGMVGALLAMLIVAAAARRRGLTLRSGFVMLVIWAILIGAAAVLFAVMGRSTSSGRMF